MKVSVFWLVLMSTCGWFHQDADAVPTSISNLGIYGGAPINITDAPFMAQLVKKELLIEGMLYKCGASIIHEQYLVTAAQCIEDHFLFVWTVFVGSDIRKVGTEYEVEEIFTHPQYDPATTDYDIALIKLKKKLVLSDKVKTIKMIDSSVKPKPGDSMVTMGFGVTEIIVNTKLNSVEIPFLSQEECQRDYPIHPLTDRMLCAGATGKGACILDTGGPLIYKSQLTGVVSLRFHCGFEYKPTVFSYLYPMKNWINSIIQNNST